MAKPITERVKIVGNKLSVEDCEGNIVTYDIPCTCDQGNPDPPQVPDAALCAVACALAISMFNIACSLQQLVTAQTDNPAGNFIAATQWIATEHFSADRIAIAYAMINANHSAIVSGYDLSSFTSSSPADGIAADFICIAYSGLIVSGGAVSQDWLSYVIAAMQEHTVEAWATLVGWQALAAMMTVPGLGQWQTWAVTVTGSQGSAPFYCGVWFEGTCSECADLPGEPCDSDVVVYIPEWNGVATPTEWALDNVTAFDDYGDFITRESDASGQGYYPSGQRIFNTHWQTLPPEVTATDHPGLALIYTPEEAICVNRVGFRTLTGTNNSKRLGVYGYISGSWQMLAFNLAPINNNGSSVTVDSGDINVTGVEKIAFLFVSGGGFPQIAGNWINHVP